MSDFQSVKLDMLLAKLQSAIGTPETGLLAADYLDCQNPQISYGHEMTKLETVGGGFNQPKSVVGAVKSGVQFDVAVRTGGSAAVGYLSRLLKTCAMKETVVSTTSTFALTSLASEWNSLTFWGYTGNMGASKSRLRKIANSMGSMDLSLDFEKGFALAKFAYEGTQQGPATAASQPTVTRSTIDPPALKGVVSTIMGDSDYIPISANISLGVRAPNIVKPSDAYGRGQPVVAEVQHSIKVKVYQDIPSVVDPETRLSAGTTGSLSLAWGSVPNGITISAATCQIDDLQESDWNGIKTWDLTLHAIDNCLQIVLAY